MPYIKYLFAFLGEICYHIIKKGGGPEIRQSAAGKSVSFKAGHPLPADWICDTVPPKWQRLGRQRELAMMI